MNLEEREKVGPCLA